MTFRWPSVLILLVLTNIAHAQPTLPASKCSKYPGLLCSDTLGPGTISLSSTNVMSYHGDLEILDGTILETNGNPLTLSVDGNLIIKGRATIRSFNPDAPPPAPPLKAPKGLDGVSYDSGPNSEGPGIASRGGNPGGGGESGKPGEPGRSGRDAGTVTILVLEAAMGTLEINNVGGLGGNGGDGGDGGNGGNGQQGGRGTPNRQGPIVIGCRAGPGHGGAGGPGGAAGGGGPGGAGGKGGSISIKVNPEKSSEFEVLVNSQGGTGGRAGGPGRSGVGGTGGFGGRGSAGCDGRETQRMAQGTAPAAPAAAPAASIPASTSGEINAVGTRPKVVESTDNATPPS